MKSSIDSNGFSIVVSSLLVVLSVIRCTPSVIGLNCSYRLSLKALAFS